MGIIGDAYAAMQPPRKCICGSEPQGHPSGLCDACVAKRSAPPVPRRPVEGWRVVSPARRALRAGHLTATFFPLTSSWQLAHHMYSAEYILASGDAEGEAAQLAAEDALLAVLTDAAAALGKRVVS